MTNTNSDRDPAEGGDLPEGSDGLVTANSPAGTNLMSSSKDNDAESIHTKLVEELLISNGGSLAFKRDIRPFKQRFDWDCSIAVVAMCLSTTERNDLYRRMPFYQKQFGFGDSAWSIDLCHMLKYYNRNHQFYTKYPGVDPSHKSLTFYSKTYELDKARVLELFATAEEDGISVSVGGLGSIEIFHHIYFTGPVIFLVNANLLKCLDCSRCDFDCCFRCCFRRCFQGHYVLAIGFDLKNNWIFYNNPEFGDRTCKMYMEDFDRARQARGTDCDAIAVTWHRMSSDDKVTQKKQNDEEFNCY